MAEISIIIPVYNTEKYIFKCLDSLINQTFSNIEILCINDGSIDNSLEILQEYSLKDNRIKVFTQKNLGPAKARNVGIKNAAGKYLMFCDSDDWYEPNMCEVMYKAITMKNIDSVMCNCNIINEYFDEKRVINEKFYNSAKEKIIRKNIHLQNMLLWNKIFKKSIIDKYDIKFPTGYKHDDDCFWYKYTMVCKNMLLITDKLYNYVVRENSIMANYFLGKQESYLDRLFITNDIVLFAEQNNLLKKKRKELINIFIKQINEIGVYLNLYDFSDKIISIANKIKCKIYITEKYITLLNDSLLYILVRYYFYKILSNIFFGSMKEKFKKHYGKLKQKYEDIRYFKKNI